MAISTSVSILCFAMILATAFCYPPNFRNGYYPSKRSVMFGGYYSNPKVENENGFVPQGAMTATVAGNTVATNSFSDCKGGEPQWQKEAAAPPAAPPAAQPFEEENESFLEEVTEKQDQNPSVFVEESANQDDAVQEQTNAAHGGQEAEQEEQEVAVSTEAISVTTTKKPKIVKRLPTTNTLTRKIKQQKEEEQVPAQEEQDDEPQLAANWPFAIGRGGPSYTAFFPISIGGPSSGYASPSHRRRSSGDVQQGTDDASALDNGYFPGSATAIANSFSTGKGGVASSHATSFGDPQLASRFFRNFGKKGAPAVDIE